MADTRYDVIGAEYAVTRREDPRIAALIHAALGDARTVVNVGAGAGSYEPRDRRLLAVEPSEVMIAQRDPGRAAGDPLRRLPPAPRGSKRGCRDGDPDDPPLGRAPGARGERAAAGGARPGRDPHLRPGGERAHVAPGGLPPGSCRARPAHLPSLETLARWLDTEVEIRKVPIPRDTPDWMLGSFWAHPERVLDARARAATSGFARMPRRSSTGWSERSSATCKTARGTPATATCATSTSTTRVCGYSSRTRRAVAPLWERDSGTASAGGGSRTRTSRRTEDFKSPASPVPPPRQGVLLTRL